MNNTKTPREILNDLLFPLPSFDDRNWLMTHAERSVLTFLAERLRPAIAIEVGTYQGGSLAVIAHYSAKVYSLELEPWARQNLSVKFPNVEFITGNSNHTLGPLLCDITARTEALSLILLDGSKHCEGETADIERVLDYRPVTPLFIVMHDSFNPGIRRGILGARWSRSPFVHMVELDFVPGYLHDSLEAKSEMWSGLGLAIMLPYPREKELEISESNGHVFRSTLSVSAHKANRKNLLKFINKIVSAIINKFRLIYNQKS